MGKNIKVLSEDLYVDAREEIVKGLLNNPYQPSTKAKEKPEDFGLHEILYRPRCSLFFVVLEI